MSSLAGRNIVVTRPAGQAAHLAGLLAAAGAHPVLYPVLEIAALADPTPIQDAAIRLEQYQWAVFVSPNAVEHALAVVLAQRSWPAGVRVATVGRSSEEALAQRGVADVLAPQQRFDSEALLQLAPLQDVRGQRVIIFRGDGGRDLFGDVMRQRGAEVDYVACYHRRRPDIDPEPLHKLWLQGRLDAVTVTSSEGLRNLFAMVGKTGQSWLKNTATFAPHERIVTQAKDLGMHNVVATAAADAGLVAGLLEYFSRP